eukprot:gene14933-20987_t
MGRSKAVKPALAWRREEGRLIRVVGAPEQCGLPTHCNNDWAQALSNVMPVLADILAAGGRYDHLSRLAATCKALRH